MCVQYLVLAEDCFLCGIFEGLPLQKQPLNLVEAAEIAYPEQTLSLPYSSLPQRELTLVIRQHRKTSFFNRN
jgi:hypothetical protein